MFLGFFFVTQSGHVIRAYRLSAIISNTWTAMLILHTTDSTDNLVIWCSKKNSRFYEFSESSYFVVWVVVVQQQCMSAYTLFC